MPSVGTALFIEFIMAPLIVSLVIVADTAVALMSVPVLMMVYIKSMSMRR